MNDIKLLCIDDIIIIHKEAIEMFGGSVEYYQDTVTKVKSIIDTNILTLIMINIQRLLRKPPCFGIFLPRTTVSLMVIRELDFMPQLSL